jgi:decaprenylphospho-beta-D-erythro-pentofuranosid-2-ulose 2-reductase
MTTDLGKRAVLFGATSGIVTDMARILASRGWELCLVARDARRCEMMKEDLVVRGSPKVIYLPFDGSAPEEHAMLIAQIEGSFGEFGVAIIGHGTLPDQKTCEESYSAAAMAMNVNLMSPIALLTEIGNRFDRRGSGQIVIFSSVAGDRGRKSNYVYGAAKGALTLFAAGLRNRLSTRGVNVLTVKPGFVDTPMTAHLKKGPLFAAPGKVAAAIVRGMDRRKDEIYVPWFWFGIMTVIRSIPEGIFKKLSL